MTVVASMVSMSLRDFAWWVRSACPARLRSGPVVGTAGPGVQTYYPTDCVCVFKAPRTLDHYPHQH